jgi:uncharacterized protein YceH (UPF0502 family)
MDDLNSPATKGDLAQMKVELKADFRAEMKDLESRLEGKQDALEQRLVDRISESARDMETRILQAFYSFAESNQTRLTATEREAAAMKDRLASVESRITELEKRLNFPPAA